MVDGVQMALEHRVIALPRGVLPILTSYPGSGQPFELYHEDISCPFHHKRWVLRSLFSRNKRSNTLKWIRAKMWQKMLSLVESVPDLVD